MTGAVLTGAVLTGAVLTGSTLLRRLARRFPNPGVQQSPPAAERRNSQDEPSETRPGSPVRCCFPRRCERMPSAGISSTAPFGKGRRQWR
ncbi:MAG: hypothetical protein GDA47_00365 [Rhodospirillales bacterium]|nr:hypothetical protein [Rhodospirillales bacterium]